MVLKAQLRATSAAQREMARRILLCRMGSSGSQEGSQRELCREGYWTAEAGKTCRAGGTGGIASFMHLLQHTACCRPNTHFPGTVAL